MQRSTPSIVQKNEKNKAGRTLNLLINSISFLANYLTFIVLYKNDYQTITLISAYKTSDGAIRPI